MGSSKFFFPNKTYLNSGVRLLLDLYYVIAIKYAAFFTIFAKLTMVFTFTTLLLNFYTSVSGLWFRIWTKILADRRIRREKGTDWRICVALFTPSLWCMKHCQNTVLLTLSPSPPTLFMLSSLSYLGPVSSRSCFSETALERITGALNHPQLETEYISYSSFYICWFFFGVIMLMI